MALRLNEMSGEVYHISCTSDIEVVKTLKNKFDTLERMDEMVRKKSQGRKEGRKAASRIAFIYPSHLFRHVVNFEFYFLSEGVRVSILCGRLWMSKSFLGMWRFFSFGIVCFFWAAGSVKKTKENVI